MSEDHERSKTSTRHVIGVDLSAISSEELRARISELEAEINRINAEILRKEASRRTADSFFSPKV